MTDETKTEVTPEETSPKPFEVFIDHQKKAFEETGKAIEALLPEAFVTHSKEAGREFVAGFKVLADAVIDEFEKVAKVVEKEEDEDEAPASTTGKTKVKVQVD